MSRPATATSVAIACALALVAPARAQRPNQAEDESTALVEEGRNALKHHDLDDAAKALDQAINLNSRRVEAYVFAFFGRAHPTASQLAAANAELATVRLHQ